ncbi:uncharacterized protein LOC133863419 [Alnus glutinosa]|uniref:uncharacterized protein LOC133863419 n=1 Tax=Alnus glutinosa TaxID=3517 RepID=UPI002D787F43|nr:uncharacterized protein LOC133863419 [Alnus glutinosa]
MEAPMKYICLLMLFVTLGIAVIDGAGECGISSPDMEATKLVPCAAAAQYQKAGVSDRCCSQVKKISQNPRCLCAAMLSDTARDAGAKPEVAATIPKRCNIANRPVGYKCGGNPPSSFISFNLRLQVRFDKSYILPFFDNNKYQYIIIPTI